MPRGFVSLFVYITIIVGDSMHSGALTSGRGSRCGHPFHLHEGRLTRVPCSRFILANTEQLHDKIVELSERVRQLEDALGDLQSKVSDASHPLLAPELLRLKTFQDLYGISIPPRFTQSQITPIGTM
jgi:hypothetical protein